VQVLDREQIVKGIAIATKVPGKRKGKKGGGGGEGGDGGDGGERGGEGGGDISG